MSRHSLSELAILRAANIILASSSPRRVEILNSVLGLGVQVIPSTFPEDLDKSKFSPEGYVMENAKQKALEVFHRGGQEWPCCIIGADTVVTHEQKILEKPKDEENAKQVTAIISCTIRAQLHSFSFMLNQPAMLADAERSKWKKT